MLWVLRSAVVVPGKRRGDCAGDSPGAVVLLMELSQRVEPWVGRGVSTLEAAGPARCPLVYSEYPSLALPPTQYSLSLPPLQREQRKDSAPAQAGPVQFPHLNWTKTQNLSSPPRPQRKTPAAGSAD